MGKKLRSWRGVRFITTHFYCELIGSPFEREEYGKSYLHQTLFVPIERDVFRKYDHLDIRASFDSLGKNIRKGIIDFFDGEDIKKGSETYTAIVDLVGKRWAGEGAFTGVFNEVDKEEYVSAANWVLCLPIAILLER